MSAQAFPSRHFSWGASKTHADILKDPHPDLPGSTDSLSPEAVDPSRHDLSQISTSPSPDITPFDTSNFTDHTTTPSSTISSSTSTSAAPPDLADVATNITPAAPGEHLSDLVALNPNVPLDELLRSPEAASVITSISDLPSIDLWHRFYSIPGWVADALMKLHDLTGLPWWGTIVMMTIGLRLCLFPVIIGAQKYAARMALHGPRLKALQAEMAASKAKGDDMLVQYRTQELVKYIKENNINPLEGIKPLLIQAPMLMGMFFGIRRLAEAPLPGFLYEGFGWVQDLTLADPLYILPVATLIFQNLALRTGVDGNEGAHIRNFFPILSIGIFFFIKNFPAALLVYWLTAAAATCLQAVVLRLKVVRRYAGLPAKVISSEKPPTFKDTYRFSRKWLSDKNAEALAKQHAKLAEYEKKEMANGLRQGTSLMVTEKIRVAGKVVPTPKTVPAGRGPVREFIRETRTGDSFLEGTTSQKEGERPSQSQRRPPPPRAH